MFKMFTVIYSEKMVDELINLNHVERVGWDSKISMGILVIDGNVFRIVGYKNKEEFYKSVLDCSK